MCCHVKVHLSEACMYLESARSSTCTCTPPELLPSRLGKRAQLEKNVLVKVPVVPWHELSWLYTALHDVVISRCHPCMPERVSITVSSWSVKQPQPNKMMQQWFIDVLFPSSKHCLNMERITLCCVRPLYITRTLKTAPICFCLTFWWWVFLWKQQNTKIQEGPENDPAGLKSQQKLSFLAFLTLSWVYKRIITNSIQFIFGISFDSDHNNYNEWIHYIKPHLNCTLETHGLEVGGHLQRGVERGRQRAKPWRFYLSSNAYCLGLSNHLETPSILNVYVLVVI